MARRFVPECLEETQDAVAASAYSVERMRIGV